MGSLGKLWFKKEKLEEIVRELKKNGEKGVEITFSIHDETNEFGQNVSAFRSQTKEERADGEEKDYIGNGAIFWTEGEIEVAEKRQKPEKEKEKENKAKPRR